MSPHGFTGSPYQSSHKSENKFRLARPLTLPNFVALRQEVCKISAVVKICAPWGSRPKFTLGHQHNVAWAEVYLRTKWHVDPSSRLATIDHHHTVVLVHEAH